MPESDDATSSDDLRERVVSATLAGESCRSAARRFGSVISSVVRWTQRHRATGSVAPVRTNGHRKSVLEPHRALIAERIGQISHLTLHDLKEESAARGVHVSHNAAWLFLLRQGLRFKKLWSPLSNPRPTSRAGVSDGAHGRSGSIRGAWSSDETWIKANEAPLRGRGPKGQRLRSFTPYSH